MKCPRKEFREIIAAATTWPEALQILKADYGISSERDMRRRAKSFGVKPMGKPKPAVPLEPIPDGYGVKGISTLVGPDGETKIQWVKTDKEKEDQLRLLKEFVAGLSESIKSKSTFIKPPKNTSDELLTNYIEPEPHFGMHSWAQETRENYDVKIASNLLKEAVSRLIAAAPDSRYGMITGLGDGLHADNQTEETTSGNKLDTDTRWGKIIRAYAGFYQWWIHELLKKHEIVLVKRCKGNHDDHSTTSINLMLGYMFENNPRVVIDQAETVVKYHRFGQNLIGMTHGDKSKGDNLPLLMANDEPQHWGACKFRYFQTGHIHHLSRKEYIGCVVESFRSIAAKDAWHSHQGYRAGREMQMIVFHIDFGEIERHTVNTAQLQESE